MTAVNELELQGNFDVFPPAEILAEIRQARIHGSLRLSRDDRKVIVYFRGGTIIFAVSNRRSSRLFEMLLSANRIGKKTVSECPAFANDRIFGDYLIKKCSYTNDQINALFAAQIENTLRETADWDAGEWAFSPLIRLREDVGYDVKAENIFAEFARRLNDEKIAARFSSYEEKFSAAPAAELPQIQLSPPEAFIFSRFGDAVLTVNEIRQLSVLPPNETLRTLYVLWLGGLLVRREWNAAFSPRKIEAIRAAKVSLIPKEEIKNPPVETNTEPIPEVEAETTEMEAAEAELTLDSYLEKVENAENYYEILNVEVKSPTAAIKTNYFALAKRFHPDHFYKDSDRNLVRRVQDAFTQLAQAYETLKNSDTRETYDYKIRKELANKEKIRETSAQTVLNQDQHAQAVESFETGFEFLMSENYREAVLHLARAVHYAPEVAKFHAYYGKSLSVAEKYRHKAETEMQTAIKLDADNPTFRILLAEFFIQYNLFKRAEGELNRLLAMFPDNKEARQLLDSLSNK